MTYCLCAVTMALCLSCGSDDETLRDDLLGTWYGIFKYKNPVSGTKYHYLDITLNENKTGEFSYERANDISVGHFTYTVSDSRIKCNGVSINSDGDVEDLYLELKIDGNRLIPQNKFTHFILTKDGSVVTDSSGSSDNSNGSNGDSGNTGGSSSESINGLSVRWGSGVTSSQKDVLRGLIRNMVSVSGGTFMMGANSGDSEAYDYEKPRHSVTLSGYRIGKYEVTQREWLAVMGSNPSWFEGDNLPVERVSWDDIVNDFLPKLNRMTGLSFRLPTEAEWEYAARGGNRSIGYKYSGGDNIGSVAWYDGNSGSTTHPVGQKQGNELGLYDMSGNVWEWCSDWHDFDYYSSSPSTNPKGPSSGSARVYRGGSWFHYARFCRVSYRSYDDPSGTFRNVGLRLVL